MTKHAIQQMKFRKNERTDCSMFFAGKPPKTTFLGAGGGGGGGWGGGWGGQPCLVLVGGGGQSCHVSLTFRGEGFFHDRANENG